MSKKNNIQRGLLYEKMSKIKVDPPEGIWENVSSRLDGGSNSRRYLIIAMAAAAGLALAITVGVQIMDTTPEQGIAEIEIKGTDPANEQGGSVAGNNISVQTEEVVAKEPHLQAEELLVQKTGDASKENRNRTSKLEEKVRIAMEDVIDEMEADEEIVLAENREEETVSTDQKRSEGDLADRDQNFETEAEKVKDIQASIDSMASQLYLDSLANLALPEDVVIADISGDRSKWQIGASLSPIFSYRDASSPDIRQNQVADNSETGRISYSGGVRVSYLSTDRLSIESGLYYNKMGLGIGDFTRFESLNDYWVDNKTYSDNSIVSLSNSIGTITSLNEDVFLNEYGGQVAGNFINRHESSEMVYLDEVVNSFEQSLEYLEIPFNVKYKVINRDFKLLLIGGLSTNLLVGNSVSANTSEGKVEYGVVEDIRTVNYSGNAGLGFMYSFSGNLSLSLEPRFRYYLNSVNLPHLPSTRPYVLGLYTGVNYTF